MNAIHSPTGPRATLRNTRTGKPRRSSAHQQRIKPSLLNALLVGLWVVGSFPAAVGVRADTLYVSNYGNDTISRIDSNGVVSTLATVAAKPYGLAFDSQGYLYAASAQLSNKVTQLNSNVVVRTLTLPQGYDATDMTFDSRGRLYVASQGGFNLGRFAATGGVIAPFGTNRFNLPFGLAFDRGGNLFVADSMNGRITTVAPDGTAATFKSGLSSPWGIAFDSSGNLYAATVTSVKKIAPDGTVSTFATGFGFASGLAFGPSGDLYVVDQGNNSVKRVTPDGTVHAFATGLSQPLFIAVEPGVSAPGLMMPVQTPEEIGQSGARFFLTGGINHYYQVLYSTDLAAWTPFQTNQIVAGSTLQVVDSGAANDSRRFYRARLLP